MAKNTSSAWVPPRWVYVGKKPPNDTAYFENLTRVIFTAGLNWSTIEAKWDGIRKAFKNFSIEDVARFVEDDVKRLMNDQDIVRNRAKICATIENAKQFISIKNEFGSFRAYLDSLDKSENYSLVIKELERKFKHVGPSTAGIFLWSVGEPIEHVWQ